MRKVFAISALLGSAGMTVADDAGAAAYAGTLSQILTFSNNSPSGTALNISSSAGLSWAYDDVTNLMTQTGGTLNARATTAPTTTLFRQLITGLVIGNGGAASASSYACVEGNFGANVGASICGNYTLGGNFTNDSTTTWGPGTAASRTIGGDDAASGPQQTIAGLNGMTANQTGPTLVMSNATCTNPAICNGTTTFNTGYKYTFDLAASAAADAVDDGPITTAPSVPKLIPVGANDIGFADPVTVTVSSQPANGTITAISDTGPAAAQTITYTATAGYAGNDSFVYSMTDGTSTDTATVTITVQPPQANDDAVSIANGTATSINVLANDQGFADPATVTITGGPSHGTATVSGSPGNKSAIRINYTPTTGYAGTDSISYQVDDGVNSDSATVSITVLSYKANDDKLVLQRDNCCQYLYVARNDVGFGSQVTITLIQSPDHEGYAYVSNSTGTKDNVYIYYYPRPYNYPNDYTETLRYQITDGTRTDTATVSIEVVRYKAVDDQTVTGAGTPVSIGVSTNDIGFSYNKTVGIYTAAQHGSLAINNNGSSSPTIVYSPAPGFIGTDTFEYAIDDGTYIDIATVSVAVIVDADNDLVDDVVDNCLGASNNSQRDTDGDGYGNWCDADLNNDLKVNFADLALFRASFATSDANADLDGNGNVNFADLARFKALFGKPPGPSATTP
jgi:hypothetical protein